ncbi:hypothetical protein CHS0354_035903, partial [Potamilus streckersoni]
ASTIDKDGGKLQLLFEISTIDKDGGKLQLLFEVSTIDKDGGKLQLLFEASTIDKDGGKLQLLFEVSTIDKDGGKLYPKQFMLDKKLAITLPQSYQSVSLLSSAKALLWVHNFFDTQDMGIVHAKTT